MTPRTLPSDLLAWVEDTAGGAVVGATRQPGGARKEAWFVDIERGADQVEPLFLRYDASDPAATGDPWSLHREAQVYLALQDTDVRVPRVLGVHPEHQAMLSERVTGETWFSRITDPAEQEATAKDFIRQLAALHRIDVRSLDLAGFPPPTTIPELVNHELDEMEGVVAFRGGPVDPLLSFALRWLRRNVPQVDGPVVLVQGDTGPGNFMYADGRVVAVVDWELAHFGDPMDDIAWLSLRSVQETFTDFAARLREYEQLSGRTIDDRRVRYYQVMAETKILVMGHRAATRKADGIDRALPGEIGNTLIYGMLHKRLWFEAVAAFLDLNLESVELAPADLGPDDWLYSAVLGELREVIVPALTGPLEQRRGKSLARVVKYLREAAQVGPFYAAAELVDLTTLLGERPASLVEGRAAAALAVDAGTVTDRDYLRYAWRRVAREDETMRPASGALADRHWPPLRAAHLTDTVEDAEP